MPITRVHTSTHITVTCHNYHSRLHTLISHTLIIHTHRTLSSNTLIILIHNTQYSLYTLFIHTHHTNSSCTLCTSLSHLPHTQHNHTCPPNSRALISHTSLTPLPHPHHCHTFSSQLYTFIITHITHTLTTRTSLSHLSFCPIVKNPLQCSTFLTHSLHTQ